MQASILEKPMKIGVGSQNFRTITGHAGKTRRFLIYEAGQAGIREIERLDLPKEMSSRMASAQCSSSIRRAQWYARVACSGAPPTPAARNSTRSCSASGVSK